MTIFNLVLAGVLLYLANMHEKNGYPHKWFIYGLRILAGGHFIIFLARCYLLSL